MISFSPIWAVTLRQVYLWRHDINNLLMNIYWPVLDILVWGFLGTWIAQSGLAGFQNYEYAALLGILLWQVVGRGAQVFGLAFCEELWQQNIVNMFSLPLRTIEWMLGVILFYIFALTIIVGMSMLTIFLLYDLSMWNTITTFLIFMPPLFLCCIWLGFTGLQILVLIGKRGIELNFIVMWVLLPFSGAYYPIEVLPAWGKILSAFVPMSYVFTGMREYVMHQQDPTYNLIIGYAMSAAYALIAVLVFMYCFNRSKASGLARLAD